LRNLLKLRTARGLSQTDVAALVDVRQGAVSSWERGAVRPSVEHLDALARVFNVEVSYLLGHVKRKRKSDKP
jgi:transcriptional regulator with XRE-family HTH domain